MPFIPNTDEDRKEMLEKIGVKSFQELLSEIPDELRFKGKYNLPEAIPEYEAKKKLEEISKENISTKDFVSFIGGGIYDHFIPSVVNTIASRPEFYTAYTPYQAEVSQGTLQAIFEFQSMVCELFDMDVANASMYDGATALAEAAHMAVHINNKKKIVIFDTVHPNYQKVVETYMRGQEIKVEKVPFSDEGRGDIGKLKQIIDEDTSACLIQQPNFLGNIEDTEEIEKIVHSKGALLITTVHPLTLGILKPPGEYNADIAVGEGQPLGLPQNFGGPLLGLFTAKREFIRRMPGRIIGETVDVDGKRGFVMTLQTREQHIRREKATSNICTNEGLCALMAAVYLSLLGKEGIKEVARLLYQKAHYLADKIRALDNFYLAFPDSPFFFEFVIGSKIPTSQVLKKVEKNNIFGGIALENFRDEWKDYILVTVTEKRTKAEMDKFIDVLNTV